MRVIHLLILFGFCAGALSADEVRVRDGSVFKGTIREISEAQIRIETGSAGTLSVDRGHVTGFSTDNPVYVRLQDGAVHTGTVSMAATESVALSALDSPVQIASIRQVWVEPGQDPDVLAREAEEKADRSRQWTFKTAGNMGGRSGNSTEQWLGGNVSADWQGKKDELKMSASLSQRESNGRRSSDERTVNLRYTSYFSDPWGWYVRQGFEQDRFKNLKLRSMSAFGLSYRKVEDRQRLYNLNLGLSYRHERYVNESPEGSNFGLDLGVEHFFGEKGRFELHNAFTLVPSLENASSYLFTQDSYVDIPLGDSMRWKMRLGLRNDYNSQPSGDVEPLDSRYYSSLVAQWN